MLTGSDESDKLSSDDPLGLNPGLVHTAPTFTIFSPSWSRNQLYVEVAGVGRVRSCSSNFIRLGRCLKSGANSVEKKRGEVRCFNKSRGSWIWVNNVLVGGVFDQAFAPCLKSLLSKYSLKTNCFCRIWRWLRVASSWVRISAEKRILLLTLAPFPPPRLGKTRVWWIQIWQTIH